MREDRFDVSGFAGGDPAEPWSWWAVFGPLLAVAVLAILAGVLW